MATEKIILTFKALSKRLSDESLTQKATLNVLAAALDYGARLVVGFVLNPLLVGGLGDYRYGLWRVLLRFVGYISPASGRATQALKWTIAKHQSSMDYEAKRRYVASAITVWLLFFPLLTTLGGVLVWFLPVWLDVPVELHRNVRFASGLLFANLILISLVDLPRSVLEGENLGYKRMGLSAALVFVGGGLTVLALYLGTGLVGVAAATVTTTLLTGALFLRVAHIHVTWFGVARPSSTVVRQFFGLSGWFLVWRLIMQVMRSSDVVLLSLFGSVELVTVYTLTNHVPETLINFVAILVFGITPGLGGIIGAGKLEKAARVRGEMMVLTWLMATVVGSTIVLLNRSFVQLWVGEKYYAGTIPCLLVMVMVTQFVLIRNDANVIDLSLELRSKVLMGLVSAILSLALAGILVGPFMMGITGLCLGFIAGRSVLSLCYPWLIGRVLGVSVRHQLKSALRPGLLTILVFALMSDLSDRWTVTTWPALVLSVVLAIGALVFVSFYGGLSRAQRERLLERVTRWSQKGSG
jgi:O-antigen/teichoic acid export membrane protein